jgi:hypothetical protein
MNKFHSVVAVILTELAKVQHRLPFFEVFCYPKTGEFEIGMETASLGLNIAYRNKDGVEELYVDFNDDIGGFSTVDGDVVWEIEGIEQFVKDILDCVVITYNF